MLQGGGVREIIATVRDAVQKWDEVGQCYAACGMELRCGMELVYVCASCAKEKLQFI